MGSWLRTQEFLRAKRVGDTLDSQRRPGLGLGGQTQKYQSPGFLEPLKTTLLLYRRKNRPGERK